MKIAILTMFNGLDETYSLVNVVSSQLKMLLDNNARVDLLVSEDCISAPRSGIFNDSRINFVPICNSFNGNKFKWHNYSTNGDKVHDSFFLEAELIALDLIKNLQNTDICIMHDILYQGWHLVHNVAVRLAQKSLPTLKFIAFSHSLPVVPPENLQFPYSCMFSDMQNCTFAYPTKCGLTALGKQYNVNKNRCVQISNCLNIDAYDENIEMVLNNIDLLGAEVVAIYPARLTKAKQCEKVSAFMGALKQQVNGAKVVFCDYPAQDTPFEQYKSIIRHSGIRYGLEENDILFTSDIGYKNGFPHQSVLKLFGLSNIFVCPSFSESFGLTAIEAAIQGNLLVLNSEVPALDEMSKILKSYRLKWNALNFGFISTQVYRPSEQEYYAEHCKKIVKELRKNPIIKNKTYIKTALTPQSVYNNQLLPLFNNLMASKT